MGGKSRVVTPLSPLKFSFSTAPLFLVTFHIYAIPLKIINWHYAFMHRRQLIIFRDSIARFLRYILQISLYTFFFCAQEIDYAQAITNSSWSCFSAQQSVTGPGLFPRIKGTKSPEPDTLWGFRFAAIHRQLLSFCLDIL